MKIYGYVQRLIDYAVENGLIERDDEFVVRNELLEALGLCDWADEGYEKAESIDDILASLVEYACENGIIEDTSGSRDLFDTKLMGILTAMPHEVIRTFRELYAVSPKKAADRYFDYSKKVNYVRAGRISRDVKWKYSCEYGLLDITINRSKPEKDPRDIAAALTQKSAAYPKCQLCPENAGFPGHKSHPARQNLRPIPLNIRGEKWQFQYSPYGYYNEHCIIFNEKHIPMKIDDSVFDKLFDIIEWLPHYFVGSNADLPIVGGSILTHEHFQGGNYTFAMASAPTESDFSLPAFPAVSAGTVKWPMSVIRLKSADRNELSAACGFILGKWRGYTDEAAGIFSETDGTPHNTITPIARRNGALYECDLVLRNNITTPEHPLGVFHPHAQLHHIKKENIGLIEVMGLAVLPARLQGEMEDLARVLVEKGAGAVREEPVLAQHADWAEEFSARRSITAENVREVIREEIGRVFEQVLCDAGVYKRTPEGKAAFMRFIGCLCEK